MFLYPKARFFSLIFMFLAINLAGCSEKEFDPNDPAKSFSIAREPYDDKNYDIALTKLGEFKSRFPYSKHAATAELLIANSHFELAHYEEAAIAYTNFAKLHPKHEQVEFALYRVGESYWVDAPDSIDREQEFTQKAIDEWKVLIEKYPEGEHTKKAKENMAKGQRRIAESFEFIAKFYCKLEIYHACAYRFMLLADEYPQFTDMKKNALAKAADALDKIAVIKQEDPESDKNIYFKTMSADQIRGKAWELRQAAAAVK